MPFEHCAAFTFSLVSVQRNAPAMSGVYGLSNAREWLLVGEADNIKAALLAHLQETHSALLGRVPTGFTFELSANYDRRARQDRLIREFEPVCNRHPN
jgi:hypothetical protein